MSQELLNRLKNHCMENTKNTQNENSVLYITKTRQWKNENMLKMEQIFENHT